MEEWIYIVLGIGWVVLSFVLKSRKKKAQNANRNYDEEILISNEEENEPFFGGLESFLDKTENFEEKNVSIKHNYPIKITPEVDKNTFLNVKNASLEKKIVNNEEVFDEHNTTEIQDVDDEKRFDLRQAVIFSEILRTPYIQ